MKLVKCPTNLGLVFRHAKCAHARGRTEGKGKDFQLAFWGQSSVVRSSLIWWWTLQVFTHPGYSSGQATALFCLARLVTTEKHWKDCRGCLQEEPPARRGCAMWDISGLRGSLSTEHLPSSSTQTMPADSLSTKKASTVLTMAPEAPSVGTQINIFTRKSRNSGELSWDGLDNF